MTILRGKATAIYNIVERKADFFSSSALTSFDDTVLHVRLELIEKLQKTFGKILSEFEDAIESKLSNKFGDVPVTLKYSVRGPISKCTSQMHDWAISNVHFGIGRRRCHLLCFAQGYANWLTLIICLRR